MFNVTATLFYGAKEIQNIENQGQMVPAPYNIVRPMRLKSGSEPGDGSGGKTMCNACYEYCLAQGVWDCPRPH